MDSNVPTLRLILHRVSLTLQNFFIGSLAESLGPIIFYAILEFRHWNTEKGYYSWSPLACIFLIILGIGLIILMIYTLRKFEDIRKLNSHNEKAQEQEFLVIKKKYEGLSVFFEEFSDSSWFQQSALLLFTFKAIIESLIIGIFFESPMTQALLLIILNSSLLAYNIIKRPFESKLALIQQAVLIFLILICNFCLMIMAGTDLTLTNFETVKQNTSNIIFWILCIFQFIPLAFFGIGLTTSAWQSYKWLSTRLRGGPRKKINIKTSPIILENSEQSFVFPVNKNSLISHRLYNINSSALNSSETSRIQSHRDFKIYPDQDPSKRIMMEDMPSSQRFTGVTQEFLNSEGNYLQNQPEARSNLYKNPTPLRQRGLKIVRPPRRNRENSEF